MALEDLNIYKLVLEVTPRCYAIAEVLYGKRQYGHADQLRRAVLSIGNNMAEGYGRATTADRITFLLYSDGSLQETKHCLRSTSHFRGVDTGEVDQLLRLLTRISIGIIEFCNSILESDKDYNGKYREIIERRRRWRFKGK